ncbi:FecR domain-containing protein [Pedobacter sp. SYP-B3415]|uniref:FecR domain-containing protein n=1 Tax=Pedobacter sp. SYP-B3415 TaxID=2496641 RepID=UPI00101D8CEF|nr:FecR domain-containing protein [Pedobacter sp. SYP-B3415]
MTRKNIAVNDDLLVKYLLNEASSAERAAVEDWLTEKPEHRRHLEQFRIILQKSELRPDNALDAEAALLRLNRRLEQEQYPAKPAGWRISRRLISTAAMFVLLAGLGWITYYSMFGRLTQINISTTDLVKQDTLPDGTFATLNKHSSLSYPNRFTGGIRQVKLQGEAFFNVSPDKSQPFIITVNDIRVRVVGTSFNVRSRNGETTVTVASGKVEVSRNKKSVALTAGQKTRVTNDTMELPRLQNSGALYNYYVSGTIVCDNTPLGELIPVLNDKFDADLTTGRPELNKLPISTTFRDESLQEIIGIISETFGLRVEYRGKQIILK